MNTAFVGQVVARLLERIDVPGVEIILEKPTVPGLPYYVSLECQSPEVYLTHTLKPSLNGLFAADKEADFMVRKLRSLLEVTEEAG